MLFEIFEEKFTNVNAGVGAGCVDLRCGTGREVRDGTEAVPYGAGWGAQRYVWIAAESGVFL